MSKYLSTFTSEAQWQAAVPTLDYPHVSLINSTGDVKYLKTQGYKDILSANFGDIIVENISESKMYAVEKTQYSLTDFPLESFVPIAVCIQDFATSTDYRAVYLSTNYANTHFNSSSTKVNVSYSFYVETADYTSESLTSEFISTDIQQYFKS